MARSQQRTDHTFSRVPSASIQRTGFKRNSGLKTSFDAGYLVPIFVDEVVPSDSFNVRMTAFGRLATPLHPFMDNLYLDTFFFFVPNRLIWDNWERFNGAQDNPADTTDYLVPQMGPAAASGGYNELSLEDYFGLPVGVEALLHNALHHRAYNLIYNEWFRDENLVDSVPVPKGDGPDDPATYTLLKRGKRHDYFTSALPWPQKGPSVMLPLGDSAPVTGVGSLDTAVWSGASGNVRETDATAPRTYAGHLASSSPGGFVFEEDPSNPGWPHLRANLAEATAATINSLRQSFQIQKLYERDARGGTRYTEIVRAHFGVISPDARLQRPEFLGSGTSMINVNPVPQTSASVIDRSGQGNDVAETPQGNLAAVGTVTTNRSHGFSKGFTEHGVIIGLACVRADLTYQQGLERMWSRQTRWDFFWPALAHIGEQSILSKELYCDGTPDDETVFGYQERFAEYRYKPSRITGRFRSTSAVPLDTWHLAQHFGARPVLGQAFIEENPPVDRVIAVVDEPHLIMDAFFQITCVRPMPMYSVPGMIDHF